MRAASQEGNEWIDGFLFVANKLILDLLNTKPVLADGPTELLPDVHSARKVVDRFRDGDVAQE